MARKPVTTSTLRHLFSHSGNRCAHPECDHILVNDDGVFVAQVAHISAAEPGGPRYDADLSDDYRRSAANLILLCYRHHREMDLNPDIKVTDILEQKHLHERKFREGGFDPGPETLNAISAEQEAFWSNVLVINELARRDFNLVREIDVEAGFYELCEQVGAAINRLEDVAQSQFEVVTYIDQMVVPFLRQKGFVPPADDGRWDLYPHGYGFERWVWEAANLAAPNWAQHARNSLLQAQVKYAELARRSDLSDAKAEKKLKELQAALEHVAKYSSHID
jgi:hypothetical protein